MGSIPSAFAASRCADSGTVTFSSARSTSPIRSSSSLSCASESVDATAGVIALRERHPLDPLELGLVDGATVEKLLRLGDLVARPFLGRDVAHVLLELTAPRPCVGRAALGHLLALRDHVDEDPEKGQHDYEQRPRGLPPARDVVAAEEVREHRDQEPEPDHPSEEDEHGPDDVEQRVVGCNDHRASWESKTAETSLRCGDG